MPPEQSTVRVDSREVYLITEYQRVIRVFLQDNDRSDIGSFIVQVSSIRQTCILLLGQTTRILPMSYYLDCSTNKVLQIQITPVSLLFS